MPRSPPGVYSGPPAATNTVSSSRGSITIRAIRCDPSRPVCLQVRPPFLDTNTPSPAYVELPPPGLASPVPTQIVPSLSTATAPAPCGRSSGHTDAKVPPASVLFHTPPDAAVAYSVSCCVGSTARPVMRPPTFVGPTSSQRARRRFAVAFASGVGGGAPPPPPDSPSAPPRLPSV